MPTKIPTTESIAPDVTESAPPSPDLCGESCTSPATVDSSNVINTGSENGEENLVGNEKVDCSDMTRDFIPSMIDCTKVN